MSALHPRPCTPRQALMPSALGLRLGPETPSACRAGRPPPSACSKLRAPGQVVEQPRDKRRRMWHHVAASQRSLHNAPIFRLLLKVAVNGTHQCGCLNFCGSFGPQRDLHRSMVTPRSTLYTVVQNSPQYTTVQKSDSAEYPVLSTHYTMYHAQYTVQSSAQSTTVQHSTEE